MYLLSFYHSSRYTSVCRAISKNLFIVVSVHNYKNTDDVEILVVGHLKSGLTFMKSIGVSPYISDVIEFGYKLPLRVIPPSKVLSNNASSRKQPDFVCSAIDKLLFDGAIVECIEVPDIVNPLTVAERKGKLRMVLDLRYLNEFVVKRKVTFEGINLVLNYVKKDGFSITEKCFEKWVSPYSNSSVTTFFIGFCVYRFQG